MELNLAKPDAESPWTWGPDDKADRAAWLEWRRLGIGSSDIALIALGPQWGRGIIDLWLEKTGRSVMEVPDTEDMYWGRAKEPVIAQRFSEHMGTKLHRGRAMARRDYPWMRCTPDFRGRFVELGAPVGLEVKSARHGGGFGTSGSEFVPHPYWVQCQWQMMVTGLQRWFLAVLIGAADYRWFTIEADEELHGRLFDAARRFWVEHVKADVAPPPDGAKSYAQWLATQHPSHNSRTREANPTELSLVRRWKEIYRNKVCAEAAEQRIKNEIAVSMGDDYGVWADGEKVLCTHMGAHRTKVVKAPVTWKKEIAC